jgi:hypothetical protein
MPETLRDVARREVVARGLTPVAVTHLTRDALGAVELANLAPVKQLLKRFFSDGAWTAADDDALATLAGSGAGWWRHDLDDDFRVEFGWRDGAFRMDVGSRPIRGEMFAGPVVPEATPNPRTIRFVTPPIHDGPSRWYASAAGVDDPRVATLFADFDDIENVLVGPAFVAVGLHRPDRWEELLEPVLRTITDEFASGAQREDQGAAGPGRAEGAPATLDQSEPGGGRALEQAWRELGSRRADVPADLEEILAAASAPDRAVRQVAARLVGDADADVAAETWSRLLGDPSRSVRRAVVDAMVDAERPALRALLERALLDSDAWTRWKALRGLVDLGAEPSRSALLPLVDDVDFRVRLEAARALRS